MKKLISLIAAFSIVLIAVTAFAAVDPALINGGFDEVDEANGLPVSWDFHSYHTEYNDKIGNALAFCETDPDRGTVLYMRAIDNDDVAVFQRISVEPSTVYRLSCYIKTVGVENGAGANIALREIIACSDGLYGDNGWTKVELVGKTGPKQDYMVVSCRVGGYSAESLGEAWFDDFTVEKLENYSGNLIPFYSGTSEKEKTNNGGALKTLLIILVSAAALAGVIVVLSKVFGKNDGKKGHKAVSSLGSYADDKSRKLPELSALRDRSFFDLRDDSVPGPTDSRLKLTKLDRILVLVLTGIYGIIAFIRLGTLNFPTSRFTANSGDSVRIEFSKPVKLGDIWQVSGISHVKYKLVADDGTEIYFADSSDANNINKNREYGHMYRWASINESSVKSAGETTGLTLTVWGGDYGRKSQPDLVLLELAIFDTDGNLVECTVPESASALFDEQDTVPASPSYFYGMYFDELYHGRTALEHIENLPVYEWTHPPLGKLIIASGILIFGMKPFGWRVMGAFFGVLMVPAMYFLAKRLLKRTELAFFSTFLFTFDFMHFTQTRIATIDVYGVFFILLMTYYMLQFISMDIGDETKKMLKPLALSGLFFGLGCASKWICLYTGVGLAVLFFVKLVIMGVRSYKLSHFKKNEGKKLPSKFWKRCGILCAWCVLFFIILPVLIYSASYFRYYTAQWLPARQTEIYNADKSAYASADDVKLGFKEAVATYAKGVIKNQKDIFNYHSGLESEHAASSTWWMWLMDLRPTWFYVGERETVEYESGRTASFVGTICSFGNPLVWVACNVSVIILIVLLIVRVRRFPLEPWFIFVCLAANFMPWVLVTRSTYAYHFFASVPYVSLAAGYLIGIVEDFYYEKHALSKTKKKPGIYKLKYVWMALVLILFCVFFPVLSGIKTNSSYVAALEWVPYHRWEVHETDENGKETVKNYRIGWTLTSYEWYDSSDPDKYVTKIYK
ncbi:MAG: phospholipid carrier-dependent glycosyltransferase [Clostridia bacterium]|nr:phospholipid carrier-dependent glycosyltransferase [Clostridia bacterium]